MENTQNVTTVKAEDVSAEEINEVRDSIAFLVVEDDIDKDSPLTNALYFLLDSLEAGQDVTLMAGFNPQEYVLAHG